MRFGLHCLTYLPTLFLKTVLHQVAFPDSKLLWISRFKRLIVLGVSYSQAWNLRSHLAQVNKIPGNLQICLINFNGLPANFFQIVLFGIIWQYSVNGTHTHFKILPFSDKIYLQKIIHFKSSILWILRSTSNFGTTIQIKTESISITAKFSIAVYISPFFSSILPCIYNQNCALLFWDGIKQSFGSSSLHSEKYI